MNASSEVTQGMLLHTPVKVLISVLPCMLFLYVNFVMLFALLRKPLLLESSRYVLFGHLLLTDSLQLFCAMLMYIFAVAVVRMVSYVCVIIVVFASITVKMSPLNLAVMSLERYVAICFPLRHADIATTRRTGVAIAVMWTVGSFDSFIQLFLFVSLENTTVTMQKFCYRDSVFRLHIFSTLNMIFTIVLFVLVSIVIIYTYIAIMVTLKSASSNARNASKAHKTILLHMIQLGLYLTSILFNTINSSSQWYIPSNIAVHVQYALFVSLMIFPKFLSPLIYGLRDTTFKHIFRHYFTFGCKTTTITF
ncbi:odorant receptor 131-2-like [Cheilinus undulatus]|uniref:odorant receptor 131-2-like n=1 Tax=Cheilinus undulatus TaxID=241271 RepID=UPI001BD50890|nr:odorant receptor 131-2-like [Cheilinus undulatus]